MKIIPGPSSQILGSKIASSLDLKPTLLKFKKFPDGEHYIKIEDDLENQDVIVIQTTSYPQNDNVMDLIFILEAIDNLNPKSISIIMPYYAYSRQDKRFLDGESLSSKVIAQIFECLSGDKSKYFISFDIHSEIIEKFFTKFQFINLSAIPLIADFFSKYELENSIIIAPDKGALSKAKTMGDLLSSDYTYLEKERSRIDGKITTIVKDLSVKDRDVIFIDDIISTGGTMVKGINMAISQGARKIYVACTHPLLINDASIKILNAGALEIIGTDSIPSECSRISLVKPIIEFLEKNFL